MEQRSEVMGHRRKIPRNVIRFYEKFAEVVLPDDVKAKLDISSSESSDESDLKPPYVYVQILWTSPRCWAYSGIVGLGANSLAAFKAKILRANPEAFSVSVIGPYEQLKEAQVEDETMRMMRYNPSGGTSSGDPNCDSSDRRYVVIPK